MTGSFTFEGVRVFSGIMLIILVILIFACQGNAQIVGVTPLPAGPPPGRTGTPARPTVSSEGVAGEIRSLVELGTPPFLFKALDLIRTRDLGNTEFGRVMIMVIVYMIQKIYPDVSINLPHPDPPKTHEYTRIFLNAEQGKYTYPPPESTDFLEYVLPFFALLSVTKEEAFLQAIPDIQKAKQLNPNSALASYFLGMAYEHSGRFSEAEEEYSLAYELSHDCYPAILSLTRIMNITGEREDALRLLSDLVIRYPDNIAIKREIAFAYYHNRDWSRAEAAIAEILQRNNRDSEFLLMQAHVLVERGQFLQAQAPLDLYASVNANNRLYLFLRARIQAEGYRNRDAALNYLRSILRNNPGDDEAAVYATRLLMESPRKEDQAEGRELLQGLLKIESYPLTVLSLEVEDAIRRGAWKEAETYLERLLRERRSSRDLLFAYQVERGLGNKDEALAYARELYEQDPANDEGAVAYVSALIDMGRQNEAGQMIESRLSSLPSGGLKSRYYYLRSRLRKNEELMMNDLRSSLFEDPRNLSALIAMFEIYHYRQDERRAVYYLKQAIALAPENPLVRRYEAEYSALLGTAN
ncbi:tetratricopeptide repeat protein [Treponema sp. TIM-1]|uniref:tetratricopeptide repeat protein n=1 Tax=Treponema sp. TIM-1 TaxID=2898417 RepID=UPI0039801DBF